MKNNNKKTIKILTVLLTIIMLVSCCTTVLADSEYVVSSINPSLPPNSISSPIISVVQYGCYAAAVIWILIVGVKYMTSAPEGKAEMKKQAFAALIGGGIMFGAGTIVKWVSQIVPK